MNNELKLIKLLGSGASAKVYEVVDESNGMRYAAKIFDKQETIGAQEYIMKREKEMH